MKFPVSSPFFIRLVSGLAILVSVCEVQAQVGSNNPTGVSGMFNGNVTTGCNYDPLTANAKRGPIVDLTVAGAVGTYGLSFTRTSNSRGITGYQFGEAGAWKHNYEWSLDDSIESLGTLSPAQYDVYLPDGRFETFQCGPWDTYCGAGTGVHERFLRLNTSTLLAYLILPDGGQVKFTATLNTDVVIDDNGHRTTYYYYSYVPSAIIDPYGLRTTFTYNGTQLTRITDPTMTRYININYGTVPGFGGVAVITSITASDGRTVTYNYGNSAFPPGTSSYAYLSTVSYYSDPHIANATYTYQAPNTGNSNGTPLLSTCNDPMYGGPMKTISYTYQTANNPDGTLPVYGQIRSENYPGGPAVSSLTVTNAVTSTETRADGKTRTFTYSTDGYLSSWTDFKNHSASQGYDTNHFVNSVTDGRLNTTNFTRDALTGNITVITYPLTQGDTPGQTQRPTAQYTYGWSGCADSNNRNPDGNHPYYLCTTTDEGGNLTQFYRDTNYRITQINYPDGGYETFTYNSFNQVLNHRMTTGGTESFSYDTSGLKQTYRNPSNASGNPTARYQYDTLGRVSGVTDALGSSSGDPAHTTNFAYNTRGQVTVTTKPTDPVDNQRHTISNAYNSDGTLQTKTDELLHVTSYTYDDYRRVKSVTPPVRELGDNGTYTTHFYYDANGTGDDYQYTGSNLTWVTLPSGKRTNTLYDENRLKSSVTVGYGTSDAATTSYGYDEVGNLTMVTAPNEQPGQQYAGQSTTTAYDQRNRPSSVTDANNNTTSFTYDLAGRKKSVTRPNNQAITYDSYDAMNRLLQQTATQTPNPNAVTNYTYTQAGLLATMQDPRLVALNSSYTYTYGYDTTGRKTSVTYPPAVNGGQATSEGFTYDTAGRLQTFVNRNGNTQTFTFDALNRMTGFSWNDGGITPSVTFGYDVASRLTSINNSNANISRVYYNDNLMHTEAETITGGYAKTMTYSYDADGNRANSTYPAPESYSFNYTYTNRNQLAGVTNFATFGYNVNGDLTSRSPVNSTSSTYQYDALDQVTHISHTFVGKDIRTLDYDYDSVGNRKWTQRDNGTGDVFGYDYADQVTAIQLNIANPRTTSPGSPTIVYDANGNRTSFSAYGPPGDTYTINNLNQYTQRNTTNATYDNNGNLTVGVDGSTYTYDQQNRLTQATKSGTTDTFKYDGLNRQVSRAVTGQPTTYSIWDGWNLVEEYQSANGGATTASYVYGAGRLLTNQTLNYYYQDASGSTSHLADSSGHLLEWYRYDLQGTPVFYNASNTQIPSSNYGIRHLFTGQQWYSELGLYDLRNRFYSPDIGRFLQPDPIRFWGGNNLYRYCKNNPMRRSDPWGLSDQVYHIYGPQDYQDLNTTYDGLTPEDYNDFANNYDGPTPDSGEGPSVVVDGGEPPDAGGVGAGVTSTGEPGVGGPGSNDLGGLGGLNPSGGWNGEPAGADRPGGDNGAGNALNQRLGDLFNYRSDSYLGRVAHYNNQHPDEAQSMVQFGNAIYYGASIYSLVGLGGMAGAEVFTAIPELLPAPTAPLTPLEIEALQDAIENPLGLSYPSSAQVQSILSDALWRRGYPAEEILKILNGGL